MVDAAKREVAKLRTTLRPRSHTPDFSHISQTKTQQPIVSDEQLLVEFQTQINDLSTVITSISELRSFLPAGKSQEQTKIDEQIR